MEFTLLICMVFCHIVDDYYLQGWLASAKQKDWWKKNCPDNKYKYDYLVALFMHSFSWTFMITLPLLINFGKICLPLFCGNLIVHFITDNAKANQKSINLIQDQIIHMCQIVVTWALCMFTL